MRFHSVLIGLAPLLLAGCDTASGLRDTASGLYDASVQSVHRHVPGDPDRDVFGVSWARADAGNKPPDEATVAQLDWKVGQLCTNGYDLVRDEAHPAEDGQQLADRQVVCRPYSLSVVPDSVSHFADGVSRFTDKLLPF